MKILITGAFGYVGFSVVNSIINSSLEADLVLYDIGENSRVLNFFHGQQFSPQKISMLYFDSLLNNRTLRKALEGVNIVIHLAAKATTPFDDSSANGFDQINNWGTSLLMDEIENSNTVKKVIYLSTISVYGNTNGKLVDEDYPPNPQTFYGKSKLKGEKHILRLSKGIETYIIRSGNVFGYNNCFRKEAVINKFIFDANFKNKLFIQGSGEQKRAFTSVDFLSNQILSLIKSSSSIPQLFNFIEFNYSINDLAKIISEVFPDIELIYSLKHMQMKNISVQSKYSTILTSKKELKNYILEFKNQFSFSILK